MIALSSGIKISAVHCLVVSQSTRVTDRRTDRQADRQNYDSQDRASIAASRGKRYATTMDDIKYDDDDDVRHDMSKRHARA